MHTQLAEALTKTNSVGNDPATARESSKLVRPAKAPNRPSGGYAFPHGQRTPNRSPIFEATTRGLLYARKSVNP